MVDISNLEPTTISRDLKNKYILIFSQPKVGKTSFAAQFPKSLLLAFEKGYNMLSGVRAVDIPSWREFKAIVKQLKEEKNKQLYDSIIFDTVGIAWGLCEKYICAKMDVDELGEIGYGKGYTMCTKEFEEMLREITLLGYGLIFISHSEEKPIKQGSEETVIRPAIPRRAYEIVNRIVDIIGYIGVDYSEDGSSTRTLYTRGTPEVVAGSRLKYMKEKIPFGYEELVRAMVEAIEEEEKHGAKLSNEKHSQFIEETSNGLTFEETMTKAKDLWFTVIEKGFGDEALASLEKNWGKDKKLSQATEKQKEIVELIIVDLEELIK